LISVLMLIRGLETLGRANPAVLIFWLLIGAACAYKLFRRPSQAS
jgi:hypothetical protein